MANTVFLRLEGPMQSWGERAHWSVRDTAPEPTKSGVIGLVACALGLSTDEDLRSLSHAVRMGVRCDQPGTPIVDYHTVVGGVLSAAGKIKYTASTGEPETVVSSRHYLCDASFLVALRAEPDAPELIQRIAQALRSPCWPVYLGRKSCPPSRPILEGVGYYGSLSEALSAWPAAEEMHVRLVIECAPEWGVRRRDELESRSHRVFGPRYTREEYLALKAAKEE